jgi:hypothetical protein
MDTEYETEWRIALRDHTGYISIPLRMIDGVIFGLRTDQECQAQIRSWANERAVGVELLRIRNKNDSFELEVVAA